MRSSIWMESVKLWLSLPCLIPGLAVEIPSHPTSFVAFPQPGWTSGI